MTKVAFVVQRCGLEVNGGAETLCLKIAERMSKYWDLEILTTCALDYVTWANHYPPGLSEISGVKVRRFRVDETRNNKKFNQLSERIHSSLPTISIREQELWMRAQGPNSSELHKYVEQNHHQYDTFIFFTYLYATTYFILPIVKDKAFLAPLAHDEWTIYMSIWDSFFEKPKGFIFNTIEERDLIVKMRFPQINLAGPVIGIAVDSPPTFNVEQFRHQYNIHEPFFLYMGRIDPSKGCEEMFDYFMELKQGDDSRKLVLLGKPSMQIPSHPDIIFLGFVDEQTKWNALAACDMLLMPSPYESLSIVLLEAWKMCKPVLVNGKCKVLVGQCRRAQGGLWYTNKYEFQVALENMTSQVRNQLGLQGKKFVENHYTWSVIEQSYLTALTSTVAV